MRILYPFVLLIVFGAALVFVQIGFDAIKPVWNRRIERYVAFICDAHQQMGEPVGTPWAQRLVTLSIFVPFALFTYATAWPIGVMAAIGGGSLPYWWTRYKQHQSRQTLDNQLVDALILMANSMKSGLSLQQAIELAATESKKPIVAEFETVVKEVQLGQSIDQALLRMSERVSLPDLEMAVHSIVTLRETGGNLSETFMTVANTVVERKKVEGKIAALTSQGVYQGLAMCAMPFIMAGIFYVSDPGYMKPMMTTALGWAMWMAVILLDVLGMWAIMKVVKIDV